MNILGTLSRLWPMLSDASERWDDAIAELGKSSSDDARDLVDNARDDADPAYRIVDRTAAGAKARYKPSKARRAIGLPGRIKRTAYAPVDLRTRRVVLVVHQRGVEQRLETLARTAHRVTAQEVWAEDGTVYVVHPDETRLVAANRFNRAPYHALNFEVAGNFPAEVGTDRYYKPEIFGRSVLTVAWAQRIEARLTDKIHELREQGIDPWLIAPHRVAGRDEHGNPNRQICCSPGPWAAAERAAAATGVPVPAPDYAIGGLPIPESWRSEAFAHCRTVER